ncbi:hypothetical protein COT97_03985 [Candidatus Falkowbacteria bacterium CG10_big_fil_rev_8_21_14_0_10_39_11]|uniref:Uncharacterized protein n=1 Tax=Candidatus Falkowbacteria bacterium CG10_big_fil_rev_8_21_14_0_10_39_11 TaxID=1974565 RepID=A0A2H0V4C6_9BACT|nr:MAG: hypothetical protein COT97_03985 [Candidatus Falkowbacteria bacterium CG10_big_fil_rev_8_21_14_0_10_39_11]
MGNTLRVSLTVLFILTAIICVGCKKNKLHPPPQTVKLETIETVEPDTVIISEPSESIRKKDLSRKKLIEITDLIAGFKLKVKDLNETIQVVEAIIDENVTQIKAEKSRTGKYSYDEAAKNERIRTCLEAIKKAHAHKQLLIEAAKQTTFAQIDLEGMKKQLDLDILVLDKMEDEKLDDLVSRMNLVITKWQPISTKSPYPPVQPSELEDLDDIYDKYIAKEEREKEQKIELKLQREKDDLQKKEDVRKKRIYKQRRAAADRATEKEAEELRQQHEAEAKRQEEERKKREAEEKAKEQRRLKEKLEAEEKAREEHRRQERLETRARHKAKTAWMIKEAEYDEDPRSIEGLKKEKWFKSETRYRRYGKKRPPIYDESYVAVCTCDGCGGTSRYTVKASSAKTRCLALRCPHHHWRLNFKWIQKKWIIKFSEPEDYDQ